MDSWLAKIRSLFARTSEPTPSVTPDVGARIEGFQKDLGVSFLDPSLLEQALTHRSYLGSTGGDPNLSNERMEFLGDAVLELIVIEYLYEVHPEDREGALTKRKGLLVSRKVLASSAEWMKLGDYVLLSEAERESGGSSRSSILADTLEAVIGAIYLDQGLEPARRFVRDRLLVHAPRIFQDLSKANFKSQLQEHVQATFKTHPRYRVVTEVGPDHRKLFTVEVSVRGQLLGRGQGYNKKEAQQSAARNAMLRLDREAARRRTPASGNEAGIAGDDVEPARPGEEVPMIAASFVHGEAAAAPAPDRAAAAGQGAAPSEPEPPRGLEPAGPAAAEDRKERS